jgi:hypothetical protein
MGLPRFHIGDIVKASNLSECGFVEKVEEHYIISEKNFVFVYYIRMFHDGDVDIWFYDEKLVKIS